jgi:hypothetical protein
MPSAAALTIFLFGLSALLAGAYTLLYTTEMLRSFDLPQSAEGVMSGNGCAAFAMGLYYILAAWQNNRAFFKLSVPMRCLTTAVWWNVGGHWKQAAIWEGTGAILTAFALVFGT